MRRPEPVREVVPLTVAGRKHDHEADRGSLVKQTRVADVNVRGVMQSSPEGFGY
jgi:hypothetical protein